MTVKKYLNTLPGERIDQPDMQHAAEVSQRAIEESILGNLILEDADLQGRIIDGFDVVFGANTVTVNRGKAILGATIDGEAVWAMMTAAGPDQRVVGVSVPDATGYGVYVRFEALDDNTANRMFWDAAQTPAVEVARNIATRRAANWSVAIELTAPTTGGWTKIYGFDVVGGSITNTTDERRFLFEGYAGNNFLMTDTQWGGGTDRDADRATYGVKSLGRFVWMVLRQLQDVIGDQPETGYTGLGWYRPIYTALGQMLPIAGSSIIENGPRRMLGHIIPKNDNSYDLGYINGVTNYIWRTIRGYSVDCNNVNAGDGIVVTDATASGAGIEVQASGNIVVSGTGEFNGPRFEATETVAFGGGADAHTLYQDNIVKAWGIISVTQGTPGSITETVGFGYNAAVLVASGSGEKGVRITLENNVSAATELGIVVTDIYATDAGPHFFRISSRTVNSFVISAARWNQAAFPDIDAMGFAGGSVRFCFTVFGRHA